MCSCYYKSRLPLANLRPIVLLSVVRNTLSHIVLSKIASKVNEDLSPSQPGFRHGRNAADVAFGYRRLYVLKLLCAKAQRQRVSTEFLGIDLSRAFDSTRRDNPLHSLQSDLRMIRLLLATNSLEPRLSTGEFHSFASIIATPLRDTSARY